MFMEDKNTPLKRRQLESATRPWGGGRQIIPDLKTCVERTILHQTLNHNLLISKARTQGGCWCKSQESFGMEGSDVKGSGKSIRMKKNT
jgi:hypothetical protein